MGRKEETGSLQQGTQGLRCEEGEMQVDPGCILQTQQHEVQAGYREHKREPLDV